MKYRVMCCTVLSILGCFAKADLATGLRGYWPMEEGSGAFVGDVSVFGNHGQLITGVSGPSWAEGLDGMCILLDGSDDRVVVENQEFFNFYNELTVAAWVKGALIRNWQAFVSKGGEASGWQIRRHASSANAGFTIRGLSPVEDLQGALPINNANQWYLVVGTYDGSQRRIYVNGRLDIDNPEAGAPNPSNLPVIFGAANFGSYLDNYHSGLIDGVAIWNRALSPTDVNDLYNGGIPTDVIHWRWNATDPSPANNAVGVDVDTPAPLSWTPGSGSPAPIKQQVLFYGTEKLAVSLSTPTLLQGDTQAVTLSALESGYTVNVTPDSTYYWRVAGIMGSVAQYNDPNVVAKGTPWSFTTVQTVPSFTQQPSFKFVDAGDDVVFETRAKFGDFYQWYKVEPDVEIALNDNAKYSGTKTDTLTIHDVQGADMSAAYFCVVSNTAGEGRSLNGAFRFKQLLAHWPLDGSTSEATNPALDGTIVGTVGWVEAPFGTAASFTTGNYIVVAPSDPNDALLFNVYDALTVSAFVRNPGSSGFETFVSKGGENGIGWVLRQRDTSGQAVFTLRGTTGADDPTGTKRVDDGNWHHIVGIYDMYARSRFWYVDGTLDRSLTDGGLISPTSQPIMIGRVPADWANYFSGQMAHVQIYNYPMTDIEVAELYSSFFGAFCKERPAFDLDGDCMVNLNDLALIATDWLSCGIYPDCF